MNERNEEIEIDLGEILLLLYRNLFVILATTIVGAILAGVISIYAITPMYTSTSQLYILTSSDSMISLSDLQVGSSLAGDYEELIKSRPVVEQVIENLGLDMSYSELLGDITISNKTNTRVIKINVISSDPAMAKQIADEFAQISKVQISKIMKVDEPSIVEEAVVATNQSSPNNKRNIAIGAFAGLILAAGILIIRYILDDTVRTSEDVEKYLGLNTLAAIPAEGGTDNSEKKSKKKKFYGIRKGLHK